MKKIYCFAKRNWKIFTVIILLTGCFSFSLVFFVYDQTLRVDAETSCPAISDGTTSIFLSNTTFLKSYRLLVWTKINGAWPTKDGGYMVSGTTDPNIMFVPPDGFVAKLDKQGDVKWLKMLKTTNAAGAGNPRGDEDVQSIIELKDGGYLMASKVWGFIKAAEWKSDNTELDKIMFTKLDKNGNALWSKTFTTFAEHAKNSLLETADKGFLFYANIVDLTPDKIGEDSDVYMDQPYTSLKVFKFDSSGNLQWSKNIKNFISRANDSYLIQTPDGGYALAGNIAETNPEKELPYNYDTYAGVAKFDKDFNFEWAKSLESTPLQMAAAIPNGSGGYTMGWKQVRQNASVIRGIVRTGDNGYVVLGNLSGALSLMTDSLDLTSGLPHSYLIGYKFSPSGNLEWVKRVTLGFNEFNGPMVEFSMTSTTDNKMIVTGPITWADVDYRAKAQAVTEQTKWYQEKYGELEMLKENNQKSKESQDDWKKVAAVIKIAQDASRPGVFMMKMDQELNISWAKELNPQRSTINYVLKPTADSGALIGGEYETTVVQSTLFGNPTYYKDGFLVKLDGSGNVKENKNWLVNYSGSAVTEMMTPYAVSNNLTVRVDPYSVVLTARKPEFSLYKKYKTTAYAPFRSSNETLCPITPVVSAFNNPVQNSTDTSITPRTWPQINYEKAVPVETVNEKSATIHNELLPILNQVYNSKAKLTDNMGGAMLSYIFDRIIVSGDLTTIKNSLEGIGYKMQDERSNQLTMYKTGYFLIMTFSTNNKDKAFLDVTY